MPKKAGSLFSRPLFYMLLVGLSLLSSGGYFVYITYAPSYIGALTDADLLGKETVDEGDKTPLYYFDYRFKGYDKKDYEGRVEVSQSLYLSKEKGDRFPLYFIPDSPERRYVPGSKGAMIASVLMIFGLAISLISGFGLGMYLLGDREAEEKGKAVRGA